MMTVMVMMMVVVVKVKKLKPNKVLDENSSLSYGPSPQVSHSVTCHPTQVNAPRLNPSWYSIYVPRGWNAELT